MLLTLLNTCVAIVSASTAPTADIRALIEKALAEPTQITLEEIKLGEAVDVITKQSGVKIVMAAEVMRFVPEGPETLIHRVDIANIPLRDGLTRLFAPLGMTFRVADDHVDIVPKEALLNLGRAPTWAELDTLAKVSATQPGLNAENLSNLQNRIQFQVPVPDAWNVLARAIRNVGAGPGDEVLTVACNHLGWAWCLADDHIAVSTFDQQIRRRLKQPVTLRINNRTLFEVMQAVGSAVNIAVRVDPGAMTSLPAQVQKNFSLNVHQQSVEQVLDTISAYTGLGYLLNPDGIMFYKGDENGGPTAASAAAAGQSSSPAQSASDPYVAKITIPLSDGRTFEWLIRKSELPDDLRQMRDRDIQAFIDEFRQKRTADTKP